MAQRKTQVASVVNTSWGGYMGIFPPRSGEGPGPSGLAGPGSQPIWLGRRFPGAQMTKTYRTTDSHISAMVVV